VAVVIGRHLTSFRFQAEQHTWRKRIFRIGPILDPQDLNQSASPRSPQSGSKNFPCRCEVKATVSGVACRQLRPMTLAKNRDGEYDLPRRRRLASPNAPSDQVALRGRRILGWTALKKTAALPCSYLSAFSNILFSGMRSQATGIHRSESLANAAAANAFSFW
jgi:hypothetical protein